MSFNLLFADSKFLYIQELFKTKPARMHSKYNQAVHSAYRQQIKLSLDKWFKITHKGKEVFDDFKHMYHMGNEL